MHEHGIATTDEIGIKQVAEAAKVSRGTVDRALHGRPGVNPETRRRILEVARSLGYRPNLAARNLRRNLRLQIAVNLPIHLRSFFDSLRSGILGAAQPLSGTVRLAFYDRECSGEGGPESFLEAVHGRAQGIILAPGPPEGFDPSTFERAAQRGIPVVCVAADLPERPRLTAVMAQPYVCGALAAEMIGLATATSGSVVAFTGWLANFNHSEKLRGFRAKLAGAPGLRLEAVLETRDQPQLAYEQTVQVLNQYSDLRAVYVSTANSLPVVEALRVAGRLEGIRVVTTDLFAELKPLLRDRVVLATIHQKPQEQGQRAFRALYEYLSEGVPPPPVIHVEPAVVLSSHLVGGG